MSVVKFSKPPVGPHVSLIVSESDKHLYVVLGQFAGGIVFGGDPLAGRGTYLDAGEGGHWFNCETLMPYVVGNVVARRSNCSCSFGPSRTRMSTPAIGSPRRWSAEPYI
jgi:hypothetical protein